RSRAPAAGSPSGPVDLDSRRPPCDPPSVPQTAFAADDAFDASQSAVMAPTGRPDSLDQLEPLLERFAGSAGRPRGGEVGCIEGVSQCGSEIAGGRPAENARVGLPADQPRGTARLGRH